MLDILSDAVKWVFGLLIGLGAWIMRKMDSKIDAAATKADFESHRKANQEEMRMLAHELRAKADDAELGRQRDNITQLFAQDAAIRNEMHTNQVSILSTLNTIASQVAHIAGRMDHK
jgi:hypothetical protein